MEDLGFDNIMSEIDLDNLFGGSDGEQTSPVEQ